MSTAKTKVNEILKTEDYTIFTAEEIIERKYLLQRLCQNTKWRLRDAMEEYAAQQVQEAKEELSKATSLLMRCNKVRIPEVLQDQINEFLTSKQQP